MGTSAVTSVKGVRCHLRDAPTPNSMQHGTLRVKHLENEEVRGQEAEVIAQNGKVSGCYVRSA